MSIGVVAGGTFDFSSEVQNFMIRFIKEELLDKIKNIDWDSIKPEENKIGGRFDFSI